MLVGTPVNSGANGAEPKRADTPGNRCTFEITLEAFRFDPPALHALAEIVHEIDLHDGRFARPEVVGMETILSGLCASERSDDEVGAAGLELFDGLYASLCELFGGA